MDTNMEIISIGLFKTGTRTLMKALQILGHKPSDNRVGNTYIEAWCKGELKFEPGATVQDEPAFAFWRLFADKCPEARFILTVRPFESWFESCSRNFKDVRLGSVEAGGKIKIAEGVDPWRTKLEETLLRHGQPKSPALEWLFGVHGGGLDTSREAYERIYDTHLHDVYEYFEGQEERLLVWNLTADPRWEPLCDWLGVPVPDEKFPWENDTTKKMEWIENTRKEAQKVTPGKLRLNPDLFEKIPAETLEPGDVLALTNQKITNVTCYTEGDKAKVLVEGLKKDGSSGKALVNRGYMVWIMKRPRCPECGARIEVTTTGALIEGGDPNWERCTSCSWRGKGGWT